MTIICCRKSPLFLVRLSYFLFLCIHFQLSDTELLTGKKSVRPLQRSKIPDLQHFRSHDSKALIQHNQPQQVPCNTKFPLRYDQHTQFLLYLPSPENSGFFPHYLPVLQMQANNSTSSVTASPAKGSTKTNSNNRDTSLYPSIPASETIFPRLATANGANSTNSPRTQSSCFLFSSPSSQMLVSNSLNNNTASLSSGPITRRSNEQLHSSTFFSQLPASPNNPDNFLLPVPSSQMLAHHSLNNNTANLSSGPITRRSNKGGLQFNSSNYFFITSCTSKQSGQFLLSSAHSTNASSSLSQQQYC